jgi:hypothetical protein
MYMFQGASSTCYLSASLIINLYLFSPLSLTSSYRFPRKRRHCHLSSSSDKDHPYYFHNMKNLHDQIFSDIIYHLLLCLAVVQRPILFVLPYAREQSRSLTISCTLSCVYRWHMEREETHDMVNSRLPSSGTATALIFSNVPNCLK